MRRMLLALAVVGLSLCAPAAAEQRNVRLVSIDPPGFLGSFTASGPNQYYFTPVVVTPNGRTALYQGGSETNGTYGRGTLFQSSGGHTQPVGVGPSGVAGLRCIDPHGWCNYTLSADGRRVAFESRSQIFDGDAEQCPVDEEFLTCIDVFTHDESGTRWISSPPVTGDSTGARLDTMSVDGSRVFFNVVGSEPAGAWEQVGAAPASPFPSPARQATEAYVYAGIVNPQYRNLVYTDGASTDGRRVFFTTYDSLVPEDRDGVGCASQHRGRAGCADVYERLRDGTLRLVSDSPLSDDEPYDVSFGGASRDGSHVFFTTREKLLPEDTDQCSNGSVTLGCVDLYERSKDSLRLVSAPAGGSSKPSEDVQFNAVSSDGSRVFFSTDESLVPEDPNCNDADCRDLYESAGGKLTLISSGQAVNRYAQFAATSAAGSHVFFYIQKPDEPSGHLLYEWTGGGMRTIPYADTLNAISADGERIIFTSDSPAISQRSVCREYACRDVYELSGGVISRISTGFAPCFDAPESARQNCPAFAAASADARRVFFVTPESLVPSDSDDLNDLYVSVVAPRACRPNKPGATPEKCRR